jgi:DNA-directed RNA polymerase subunit M/transcription elongation factor TFIIS
MVDFVTAAQAVTAGLNALRELSQVDKEYDKAALRLKIAELSNALATVQITLAEAQTEAANKDAEIAKLQANFKKKEEMKEYQGYFYRKGTDGEPRGRPYCPRCLDKGIVMMTVQTYKPGHPEQCPECKSDYQGVAVFGFD